MQDTLLNSMPDMPDMLRAMFGTTEISESDNSRSVTTAATTSGSDRPSTTSLTFQSDAAQMTTDRANVFALSTPVDPAPMLLRPVVSQLVNGNGSEIIHHHRRMVTLDKLDSLDCEIPGVLEHNDENYVDVDAIESLSYDLKRPLKVEANAESALSSEVKARQSMDPYEPRLGWGLTTLMDLVTEYESNGAVTGSGERPISSGDSLLRLQRDMILNNEVEPAVTQVRERFRDREWNFRVA